MLPSISPETFGAPVELLFAAQYPAYTPSSNASPISLRRQAHGSRSLWVASPSARGTFTLCSPPVLIGALPGVERSGTPGIGCPPDQKPPNGGDRMPASRRRSQGLAGVLYAQLCFLNTFICKYKTKRTFFLQPKRTKKLKLMTKFDKSKEYLTFRNFTPFGRCVSSQHALILLHVLFQCCRRFFVILSHGVM
jgi:hypothetical protein